MGKMTEIDIAGRKVGPNYPPLVMAEVGINHEGIFEKAIQLVDAAVAAGAEVVKFQCHITEKEMDANVDLVRLFGSLITAVVADCDPKGPAKICFYADAIYAVNKCMEGLHSP